jgi:hypothetical protein
MVTVGLLLGVASIVTIGVIANYRQKLSDKAYNEYVESLVESS